MMAKIPYLQTVAMLPKRIFFGASSSIMDIRKNASVSIDPVKDTATENEKFLSAMPDVVSNLMFTKSLQALPDAKDWVKKLMVYNSTGGNKVRGLMTVYAYQMLERPDQITEETMKKARVLGWSVELLQTSLLLLDDIMDNSSSRRGQTCWYKLPDVGLRAINDSSCMIALVFENLKMNFYGKPYYPGLVDIFNEALLQLSIGQHLDCSNARNRAYSMFTEETYNNIAIYKTAYYTYKLPLYAGSLLANKSIDDFFKDTEDLLDKFGIITLMQNDYMDCFGNELVSGKVGTDIQEGKCTWLAVQALQRCSGEQRAMFERNYGRDDAQCVQRIKRLYEDLQLPDLYRRSEQAAYDNIVRRVEALPDNVVPSALVLKLFHMVYQLWDTRQKELSKA